MTPTKSLLIASAVLSLLLGVYLVAAPRQDNAPASPNANPSSVATQQLGVFTTLPLLWSEVDELSEQLTGGEEAHWARRAMQAEGRLAAIDALTPESLGRIQRLLMAQPRALSGAENVALDDWVRAGGRVLLFADPVLTEHSRYALGDPRRPQDVALLSPILARWGLELTYDPDQPDAERIVASDATALITRQSGRLEVTGEGADSDCKMRATGLIAVCQIGQGGAVIVADAAMLEHDRDAEDGAQMLRYLAGLTWPESGI